MHCAFPYVPEEKDYNIKRTLSGRCGAKDDRPGVVQVEHARVTAKEHPDSMSARTCCKNVFISFESMTAVFAVGFRERADTKMMIVFPYG